MRLHLWIRPMNRGSPFHRQSAYPPTTRREFLWQSGGGLGAIALACLISREARGERETGSRIPHFKPKAKRVVQLFMSGAASHIDLFDFKPELVKRHGQKSDFGEHVEAFQDGLGPWLRPIWEFKPYGKSSKLLSDVVADLGDVVDDIAFIHNMVGKTGVHSQATYLQATGFQMPGFPGMGCWVSYGLGSTNDNLPAFVVLPDHRGFASNGPKNWDSAFLPAQHQGTIIYPGREQPIADLFPGKHANFVNEQSEADTQAILGKLNRTHANSREGDSRLDARIRSYELAAKMQLAAPDALDISKEPKHVLNMYGLDHGQQTFPKEINA